MKFVPWKKQMSADGKTIFLNSRTNELTDLPDPEFMELQDRLDAAR